MGFRVRRSLKIAPGVRLNVGKTRSSFNIGGKGLTTNLSKRGIKTTASIPGTGLSYSTKTKSEKRSAAQKRLLEPDQLNQKEKTSTLSRLAGFGLAGLIGYAIMKLIF